METPSRTHRVCIRVRRLSPNGDGSFCSLLFASILFSDPCRSSRSDPMIKAVQARPFSLLPTEPSAGPAPTPCRFPSSAFSSPTSTASLRSLATFSVFERESSVSNKNVNLMFFVTEVLFKFQQLFIAQRRSPSSPCRSRFIPTHVNVPVIAWLSQHSPDLSSGRRSSPLHCSAVCLQDDRSIVKNGMTTKMLLRDSSRHIHAHNRTLRAARFCVSSSRRS